ncbi:MAG: hypothetical protein Kow0054_22040 [Deferrisoma sp.]
MADGTTSTGQTAPARRTDSAISAETAIQASALPYVRRNLIPGRSGYETRLWHTTLASPLRKAMANEEAAWASWA